MALGIAQSIKGLWELSWISRTPIKRAGYWQCVSVILALERKKQKTGPGIPSWPASCWVQTSKKRSCFKSQSEPLYRSDVRRWSQASTHTPVHVGTFQHIHTKSFTLENLGEVKVPPSLSTVSFLLGAFCWHYWRSKNKKKESRRLGRLPGVRTDASCGWVWGFTPW